MGERRVEWVDIAKGICIIFVVMVHSVLGVEEAMGERGWMHAAVAFARPFRMPDFFLISGLFLGLVIDRPWLRYIDRKVVHFAYFYVLWLTIQFAFKAPGMAIEHGATHALGAYLLAFVDPFGTLWFIYLLPVMFVVTRLVRRLPALAVLASAAVLESLPIHTGWMVIDEFAARYVYFFAGYAGARIVFTLADRLKARPAAALAMLAAWAPVNGWLVFTQPPENLAWLVHDVGGAAGATGGLSELPGVSLLLGLAGAGAVIAVATLLSGLRAAAWLDWLGRHSIVIYLAFFLPMAVARVTLVASGFIADVGTVSLLTLVAGVAGPVVLYLTIQWTGWGRFLFERPRWARIEPSAAPRPIAAPAE
jgi:uncharacterized membrane protein YcfT